MSTRLPNFLIVGAAKAGTTSIYNYLKQHPEVYMPNNKEPCFFVSSKYKFLNPNDPRYENIKKILIFTFEDYIKLFQCANTKKAIGEASVPYLYYYETAIPQIKKYLRDVKIVIILRNPIDRASSAYNYLLRNKAESLTFEECLRLEEQRKKENWAIMHFYKDVGFYYKQVKAYIENFSHVKVLLFDDLRRDALLFSKNVYGFLGLSTTFVPDTSNKFNPSGIPQNDFIYYLLMKRNLFKTIAKPIITPFLSKKKVEFITNLKAKNLKKIEMKLETREYLKSLYRDDIQKLQTLINKDLSHWLM